MKPLIVILITGTLMTSVTGQYPNCDTCDSAGTIPLSPLSYNTVRSNVFNGTQLSNEGCTNGVSVDGQVTIDCGQGTTLIDCDQGNNNNVNYSDLSSYFVWSSNELQGQRVSIVFRFNEQINISRIAMSLWNSPSNSIIIPSVRVFWSNDGSNIPSTPIMATNIRTGDGLSRVFIYISNAALQFQYLRIEMIIQIDDGWIFLSEVQFCGNTAPFHITQPSTDNDVQIVSPTATMATLTCSLNITIPDGTREINLWSRNSTDIPSSQTRQTDNTFTLLLQNLQPSDAGVYRCKFNDFANSGWRLERSIRLFITDPEIIQPQDDSHVVTFDESTSSVQLTCSLNVPIPFNVTVWSHNGDPVIVTPPNEVLTTGNTATLVIGDPQLSDAGVYDCAFNGLDLQKFISLDYTGTIGVSTTTTTTTTDNTVISNASTATSTVVSATTANGISTTATITPAVASESSGGSNVGAIVASIVVVILLIAIVTAIVILVILWRKKQKKYHIYDNDTEHDKKLPSYAITPSTKQEYTGGGTPTAIDGEVPSSMYAVPTKRDKRRSVDLQKRRSIEFNYRPQRSPEMSVRSRKQTLSLINPDYDQVTNLDIYATAPNIPERTKASHHMVSYDKEDIPVYSEAINPSAIEATSSHDYSSVNDTLYPYSSIYADPLPLVKSEGPPNVFSRNIKPLHQLGVGQFGEVILAETVGLSNQYLGIGNSNDTTISMKVAVKTLKSSPSEDVRKSFEKEIKFMSRLKDTNVIKLLGICTTGTPFIMMEYMENGDLSKYLQQFEFTKETERVPAEHEITLNALVCMSHQIASGMKYLSSCKFVHRDLAARNILVGVNYTVKIADFGMSQNLYGAYYCKVRGQKVLPIRWMATQCFYGKFSVHSDVWAFGITLWEIFTLCRELPYDNLSDQEMIDDAVKGPNRSIPHQPEICPDDIYYIMKSCWRYEPSERPRFSVLCDQLNEYYSNIL